MNTALELELKRAACAIRLGILDEVHAAASGHPGGSLSCTDVLTWLYFHQMRIDPARPRDPERDRFVLSKGHSAPAVYATLAQRGYFPKEELLTLRALGSRLQGHPNMNLLPGVDMSTGSLGQGVSAAVGMALAAKLQGSSRRVYTLLGDGELQEGQAWEALMSAAHYHLDNLCVLIDQNGLQIDGKVSQVMDLGDLSAKLSAFGLSVTEADGHDFSQLEEAFRWADQPRTGPCAIVLHTVKGKGISFMEDSAGWHGKAPSQTEYESARVELLQEREKLEAQHDCVA